jgi:hypothetical protein
VGDFQIPPDVLAWLVLWEASIRDRDNDQLAHVAGDLLLTSCTTVVSSRAVVSAPI